MWREDRRGYEAFQRSVGATLIAWGAASVAAGLAALPWRNQVVRQAGIQAIAWGAIDAAIGAVGLRDAARRSGRGERPSAQARRFRWIVLANAALDIGYIGGGIALMLRSDGKPERAGMGVGIVIQGLFLLVFDLLLALLSSRWTRGRRGSGATMACSNCSHVAAGQRGC